MTVPGLATAADYSEAIGVARRAKSVIALLLLLMLVAQLTTFFLLRYNVIPSPAEAATQPSTGTTARLVDLMQYVTAVSLLGGITLSILLAVVLCLIVHIMLVGRLIGVGKVTSSLIWSFVLLVFLFPWQTWMNTDFHISGVFWTWSELTALADGAPRFRFADAWTSSGWAPTLLAWFRFAAAPIIAVILILIIQLKSNRGIRMAMGEDEVLNQMMNETM